MIGPLQTPARIHCSEVKPAGNFRLLTLTTARYSEPPVSACQTDVFSFEWISQLRYYWEASTSSKSQAEKKSVCQLVAAVTTPRYRCGPDFEARDPQHYTSKPRLSELLSYPTAAPGRWMIGTPRTCGCAWFRHPSLTAATLTSGDVAACACSVRLLTTYIINHAVAESLK